ncbi:MAG: c-type cytochrome [Acidobacteria bacterium]|nr:c-type cytochrome [Acidobacteriota bacterium]
MRLALAIASFVILIVHGAVFYDQFFNKWERHQTAYFDQARSMAKTDAERAGLEGRSPRIEQLIVTSFGESRVDRCTTCHIGIDDPRFNQHAQPLRSHPYTEDMGDRLVNGKWERRHKFADFGCTVCHDGQGRGLETVFAHGEDHYWPDPMLGYVTQNWRADFKPKLKGKEYMQANCALCHTDENFKSTPLVAKGRQLFFSSNCYGCHKIEGLSTGALGPDLSEVGKKFKVDYLWESVVEPRANIATSFMPKFNLSDDDVRAMVVFLKSRRGVNFSETSLDRYRATLNKENKGKGEAPAVAVPPVSGGQPVTSPAAPPAAVATASLGEKLINDRSCAACHKIGARDGGVAPDLSFEGLIKDDKWLMEHFRDPRSLVSDSIMPSFGFSNPDYLAMTGYLMGLKTPPAFNNPEEFYKNTCARCHGDKGDGHGMIAIYLDPYPRDLTKAGFMNSKTEDRLMKSIREGVAGTSMPAWGRVINDDQMRQVFNYIQTTYVKDPRRPLKERKLPETNPVASSRESIARGEQIFLQRCTGCHGKKADGKGTNSIDILPRPRNLRNAEFMNSISDRRLFESILYGVQGSAMQSWIDYGLTEKDVGDLVNYMRSFNKPKQ